MNLNINADMDTDMATDIETGSNMDMIMDMDMDIDYVLVCLWVHVPGHIYVHVSCVKFVCLFQWSFHCLKCRICRQNFKFNFQLAYFGEKIIRQFLKAS